MKRVFAFFDKLEDQVRFALSRRPIVYGLISGVGIVLFFRGVWHLADAWIVPNDPLLSSWFSFGLGLVILLLTGAFVQHFVNERTILSGVRHEKKLIEKVESEVQSEKRQLVELVRELRRLEQQLSQLLEIGD